MRRLVVLVVSAAVIAAACSSDGGSSESSATTVDLASIENQAQLDQYFAEAATIPLADSDAAVPPNAPISAGGAPGFSRYVFRQTAGGEVVPSLVEGPLGPQIRCQDPELPCSATELVELHESGDPIPDGLDITADELGDLVAEIRTLRAVLEGYEDVDRACADGFFSDRTQTPNMGSHFTNAAHIADGRVDPAKPDILLYAAADGANPGGQLGRCTSSGWDGQEMELVGSSFIVLSGQVGDDHPAGFSGGFDNWHVHHNLCRGAGDDSFTPDRQSCNDAGGRFSSTLGWMIHAWVDPQFDSQLGMFSMWNPSIWPISDPETVQTGRVVRPDDADAFLPIVNFSFGTVSAGVGDTVVFGNSDSVPHTVTGGVPGSPEGFDSGVFAPGEQFRTSFDEPGEYAFYCSLHPEMVGTVVVE